MIVFLLNVYIAILALFVWIRVIPFNLFWKLSPIIVLLVLLVGFFIPMVWGAPWGSGVVVRNSVQIIPEVAGEVIEVPVQANVPLKAADVMFRIDRTTYEAQARAIEAQLKFAELRLSQFAQLQERGTGRAFDVEERQAEVDQLRAQLDAARWNLEKTTVRAPTDGYVTNLALRKGARITAQSPVMAFIDTTDAIFGIEIPQIYARYIAIGQPAEITFKVLPGEIYGGHVETVLQAIATGQAQPSSLAVTPSAVQSAPFVVRIRLDDPTVLDRLPAGSTALAAIYTHRVQASHVIRKIMLRQSALLNYIVPF